jgi:hypothetical protein
MEGYAPGRTLLFGNRENTAAPAVAKAAAPNRSSTRARDAAPIARQPLRLAQQGH